MLRYIPRYVTSILALEAHYEDYHILLFRVLIGIVRSVPALVPQLVEKFDWDVRAPISFLHSYSAVDSD